jgi:hypothetical protein
MDLDKVVNTRLYLVIHKFQTAYFGFRRISDRSNRWGYLRQSRHELGCGTRQGEEYAPFLGIFLKFEIQSS